jgi:enamine deaminase RidA (YjgF/YER057c/UK114 family)
MFQSLQGTVARRRLLLGSTISGLGALIGGTSSAAAQQPSGPTGIQILQYDPPRPYAAGSRVGNIIYLAGEEAMQWTGTAWEIVPGGIGPQTERIFENIRTNLRNLGSDLDYIVNMTNYFVSYSDRAIFTEVRRRYVTRLVPDAAVQVSGLSDLRSLVEVAVVALVP